MINTTVINEKLMIGSASFDMTVPVLNRAPIVYYTTSRIVGKDK